MTDEPTQPEDLADCDRCGVEIAKAVVITTVGRCGYGDFCFDCAIEIEDSMPRSW